MNATLTATAAPEAPRPLHLVWCPHGETCFAHSSGDARYLAESPDEFCGKCERALPAHTLTDEAFEALLVRELKNWSARC